SGAQVLPPAHATVQAMATPSQPRPRPLGNIVLGKRRPWERADHAFTIASIALFVFMMIVVSALRSCVRFVRREWVVSPLRESFCACDKCHRHACASEGSLRCPGHNQSRVPDTSLNLEPRLLPRGGVFFNVDRLQ